MILIVYILKILGGSVAQYFFLYVLKTSHIRECLYLIVLFCNTFLTNMPREFYHTFAEMHHRSSFYTSLFQIWQ